MASAIKSAKQARDILQNVLNDRKEIDEKKDLLMGALDMGAHALERANANGASFHHEAAIVRYHASNRSAAMLCDEYTRKALKAAVFTLGRQARQEAGEADE